MDGAGVEPTSLRRCTSAVFQPSKLTAQKPDYLHRPSGVNDIILKFGGGERRNRTSGTLPRGLVCYRADVNGCNQFARLSKLAEITRPAIGV